MRASSTRLWAEALAATARRQAEIDWYATPLGLLSLSGPRATGFAASPHDLRPTSSALGETLCRGVFEHGGERLATRIGSHPWNQASPSRRFAAWLHRFEWLGDLLAVGEPGAREALRLTLEWQRVFGRWNAFVWNPENLERRVYNWSGAVRTIGALASDQETATVAASLARQARYLLAVRRGPRRAAERMAACVCAGAALAGDAGRELMVKAAPRLDAALAQTVLPDGGHATRSPKAGVDLLFDLQAADDAFSQRGRPPPEGLSRAIDRLTAATRFFSLSDGRLACFQGGEAGEPRWITAALVQDGSPAAPAPLQAPYVGYQRLAGRKLIVMADAGPPAVGDWSVTACGQPMAIEVVYGRERLITNTGWSPVACDMQALRLAAGGSTATVGDGVAGAPLGGFLARALGARLIGAPAKVIVDRRETDSGVWLEMAHDGWREQSGLTHERRLYVEKAIDELRGEDRFIPDPRTAERSVPITIHFHVHPDVRASLARDQRSVLLRARSNLGWWLRNDADEVAVEPSVHLVDGRPVRTTQVVLRSRLRADRGGRVRWKLTLAEG